MKAFMQGQMISYVSTLKKAARVESGAICVLLFCPCSSDIWDGENQRDKMVFLKRNVDLCRELLQSQIKEVQEALFSHFKRVKLQTLKCC